jgi:predicted amidohydrolase
MPARKLRIATCQFPVTADVRANARFIRRQMRAAAQSRAHILHTSEAALSGYGGVDFPGFAGFDWDRLREETAAIRDLARGLALWVILGSAHYLSAREKPTNCLYLIDGRGRIVDRYDKSMLTTGDRKWYTPGNHPVTFTLEGITCGLMICYDSCFPEMYNRYRHAGVAITFHSYYNARHRGPDILDEIIPAQAQTRAADNTLWVVANNSCARHSCWPSMVIRPDGSVAQRAKRHVPGILYHDFPDPKLKGWLHNHKMMVLPRSEVYHNGRPSRHPRALNRQALP